MFLRVYAIPEYAHKIYNYRVIISFLGVIVRDRVRFLDKSKPHRNSLSAVSLSKFLPVMRMRVCDIPF